MLSSPPVVYGEHPPIFPEILRSASLVSLLRVQAQLKWVDTIPRQVRHMIIVFPEHQWHLLRLVWEQGNPRCVGVVLVTRATFDLCEGEPTLKEDSTTGFAVDGFIPTTIWGVIGHPVNDADDMVTTVVEAFKSPKYGTGNTPQFQVIF